MEHRETNQLDVHLSKGEMMVTGTVVPEGSGCTRTHCEDFKKQKGARKRTTKRFLGRGFRSWVNKEEKMGKEQVSTYRYYTIH